MYNILKLFKSTNHISNFSLTQDELLFAATKAPNKYKAAKIIIEGNEKIKARTKPKNNYLEFNVVASDKKVITKFFTHKAKQLFVETKNVKNLTQEEKSQLWCLFEKTFKLSDAENVTDSKDEALYQSFNQENLDDHKKFIDLLKLYQYFNKEIADGHLKFVDLLKIYNKIYGFVIYQIFFLSEVSSKYAITHVRLTAVEPRISSAFPRIMTMLLTRSGLGLVDALKDYNIGTFAEIISSSAISVFEVDGFESSLLYDDFNAAIPTIYKKIYDESELAKVAYDKDTGFYHIKEQLELRIRTKDQMALESQTPTRADLLCKHFLSYKKPQHAMLYFFENSKTNQKALARRVDLEFGDQANFNFSETNSEFGNGLTELISYQCIPRETTDTTPPQKLYSRL
jgi:hypothetical protein